MQRLESIHLVGDPNWEQCKAIARAAATNSSSSVLSQPNQGTNCKRTMRSYGGGNVLNLTADTLPTERFHALSGFFAVYNKLNLLPEPEANVINIYEKGEQLCSKAWESDLSNISGNQNSLSQYCFRVPYMASLIEHALCLGNTEVVFGPADISWTLGAGLIEGEYQWLSISETSFLTVEGLLYSPIFVFVLLMCLVFVVYFSQIKLPMLGRKVTTVRPPSLPSYLSQKHRPN